MPGFRQELVALFGSPVDENPTQVMVEAAFAQLGLDWRYVTIEVDTGNLGAAVAGARAMGFRGFHCTIPHKVAVIAHLDALTPTAERIGAVNCVVRRNSQLVGENTDGRGLVDALRRRLDLHGRDVVILGAGGAARAIAVELAAAGVRRLTLVNRTERRGIDLVRDLRALPGAPAVDFVRWEGDLELPPADVVVNATSVGLYPDVEALPAVRLDRVDATTVVADVIPNPPRTRFLTAAEHRGCETVDGLEILVEQGVRSVLYWTGLDPNRSTMRAALARALPS
jgi:shikimate dehydrogenase